MNSLSLTHLTKALSGSISITGSKSESNRLLLLQAIFPNILLENVSNSDDTKAMLEGLAQMENIVDVDHAGTTMRFLTAYFASKEGVQKTMTGSHRMQQRPISVLVEALQQLGADIQYAKNVGYPPLQINGKKLTNNKVTLAANVSSQYISALLLIAPSLPNGLHLFLEGKITSIPYIKMTCSLLQQAKVDVRFEGQEIEVKPLHHDPNLLVRVESDWSSASYYFSLVALSKKADVKLESYSNKSLQGDSVLQEIYLQLGVKSSLNDYELQLLKTGETTNHLKLDLANAPDIAQTIAVTCFGLAIACDLTGLHTLKIKETDRLEALQIELSKLGAEIEVTHHSLHLKARKNPIKENVSIDTYKDHRMAMAFAPLGLLVPIKINEPGVVSKSYPEFWDDFIKIGFKITSQTK